MSVEATVFNNCNALSEDQLCANHANTKTLLHASLWNGKHDPFKEHVENNPVRRDFDGCLKYGIELVMSQKRTLSDVVQTLMILLQNGAKWDSDDLLMSGRMTPYHVICKSTGDHQELLDLMIKELGRSLLNARDDPQHTALMYAVENANIKCVGSLIAKGADVNLNVNERYIGMRTVTDRIGPLIDSIDLLQPHTRSYDIRMNVFDLLLENGADVNQPCNVYLRTPLMYAAATGSVSCVQKLIQKGAQLQDADIAGDKVWVFAARSGSVDMLRYLLEDNGIDKDSVEKRGASVLYWTVKSGNIEAIRYLLSIGARIPTYVPQESVELCRYCRTNLPYHLISEKELQGNRHPCLVAITQGMVEVIRLLEEYGCQFCKRPEALIIAIRKKKVNVVKYLLRNHSFPINYEYAGYRAFNRARNRERNRICNRACGRAWDSHTTLLTEACQTKSVKIVNLLLEHGADPNKKICREDKCQSALTVALHGGHLKILARFLRGGLDVNTRPYSPDTDGVLSWPRTAVCYNNIQAAEMLFVSGCSHRVFNLHINHRIVANIRPKFQELLNKWNQHKNNVIPLQQRCRVVILNYLSPQADRKIIKLPLPPCLITFLSIPELDDIIKTSEVENYNKIT